MTQEPAIPEERESAKEIQAKRLARETAKHLVEKLIEDAERALAKGDITDALKLSKRALKSMLVE